MIHSSDPVLDLPPDQVPAETDFVEAAMRWHFDQETGSPFWLEQARCLDFDPRADVHTIADLARFPNVVDRLRDVRARDLIPRGYGPDVEVVGVYESGGTTGPPKRVVFLADWMDWLTSLMVMDMADQGYPPGADWLAITPSGPHLYGALVERLVRTTGGLRFTVDLDPRWVKKCVAQGRPDDVERYIEHLVEQARYVLETQDIAVLVTTPPLLERLARRDDLVKLICEHTKVIEWGGAHMDADTRQLLRTEVFPGITLASRYGSTMILGAAPERLGLDLDEPCVYDPPAPYLTFSVVDPDTGRPVPYGERGRVVMNHVSRSAFLPNNLERDVATRIEPPPGQASDSVADVAPVAVFDGETVVEGVY
jgi:phenylacetate-coenzyme A ligase PaaK-like adenylate-forming protein